MNLEKLEKLKKEIYNFKNLAIAFSGGVDSSFLAFLANDLLKDNTILFTIKTDYMSKREIDEAANFAKKFSIRHKIINIKTNKIIENNPQNRCYVCKKHLFSKLKDEIRKFGFSNLADGTNLDDLSEYRPGLKAAEELGVFSPLKNLRKKEIREFSQLLNLPTYDKPSYPCLLTRFEYGYKFSKNELKLIEFAENLLIEQGIKDVRARFDGKSVKFQLNQKDMLKFLQNKDFNNIIKKLNDKFNGNIFMDLKGLKGDVLK
ncbi:ATP-dependent sacrificial sulfur transferase LarE [Campylobacter geochelonis]|uniref:ATP-dependent sacrificial sulfur transferase LarE n=1 Tax=Campylobacter geochelonis TaxID=1780362 RepID=UPI000770A20E|nr:ATP-dependent sacrificial sulfur transferase LarE [Campylobacter geochelonis]CZE46344.1 NAD+ synthetase [Campylobacter geochelonis]